VIIPHENEPDLSELPPETRDALEFVLADSIEDVFDAAFNGKWARRPRRLAAAERRAAAAAR
jgi:ATP-dependent Lon protease